jgi:hypothetical protein
MGYCATLVCVWERQSMGYCCNTPGVKLAFALHFMSISIICALTFMLSKVPFHVNA